MPHGWVRTICMAVPSVVSEKGACDNLAPAQAVCGRSGLKGIAVAKHQNANFAKRLRVSNVKVKRGCLISGTEVWTNLCSRH